MGVAFVGKGLGFVGPSSGVVTPADFFVLTYRLLAESGFALVTETSQYLRLETDG